MSRANRRMSSDAGEEEFGNAAPGAADYYRYYKSRAILPPPDGLPIIVVYSSTRGSEWETGQGFRFSMDLG